MFFNHSVSEADFERWSKLADWTIDEAIALSFGKDPDVVNWKLVQNYGGRSGFADQYLKRRQLALRAVRQHQLDDPVTPGCFLAWAKHNDVDFPAELGTQVVARGHQIADWKSLYDELSGQFDELKARHDGDAAERDLLRLRVEELEKVLGEWQNREKPLSTKERQTALKLIIGMAVAGYGYDPQAKRSDKISEIAVTTSLSMKIPFGNG
jgi:rhodanese-related sulfurtransferase